MPSRAKGAPSKPAAMEDSADAATQAETGTPAPNLMKPRPKAGTTPQPSPPREDPPTKDASKPGLKPAAPKVTTAKPPGKVDDLWDLLKTPQAGESTTGFLKPGGASTPGVMKPSAKGAPSKETVEEVPTVMKASAKGGSVSKEAADESKVMKPSAKGAPAKQSAPVLRASAKGAPASAAAKREGS